MAPGMLLLALCAAVAIQIASAHNGVVHVTWTVGDDNGWNWPTPNGYNFTAWAAKSSAIKKSDKLSKSLHMPCTSMFLKCLPAS